MANDKKENAGENGLKEVLRAGGWVLMMLTVLTFGEFLLAVIAPPWGYMLLLIAAWKSYYVVKNFMHIGRLFGGDEEAH